MMQYVLARFSEPSTWRGIVSILTAAGIALSPQQIEAIITVGLLVVGLIGAVTKDSANGVSVAVSNVGGVIVGSATDKVTGSATIGSVTVQSSSSDDVA